ncbi:MAG: ABC-F family ATP-binding cassette domain-containing protein [Bacteroidales bacterium]|nr:ABC-F family ATP-binding cassette domain-containing protein [Bacteroidales bacterium]
MNMNLLSVKDLSKHYGEKVLFKEISFGLNKGDKIALIAENGTGKSSLLKIMVRNDVPDEGSVVIQNGLRIGFLEQEPQLNEELTINELIKEGNSGILSVIQEYEQALEAQTNKYNDKTHKTFEIASEKMDRADAWDYDRRLKEMLTRFNIFDLEQKTATLSGGQKKRLALSLVLLDNPDLLLLDEPTNHLDIEMIEWLEKYLTTSTLSLLMVTHDRYFLDRVCNSIIEMSNGKIYRHQGNYSYFLRKKSEREEVQKTETAKARKLMKKELEWMRRSPLARTTKSKSRIDAFYKIQEKASRKIVEKDMKLEINMARVGGKILELKDVKKSYSNIKILDGFEYMFKKGERIGIIGKNGVGKSSFLNILTGKEKADSGKVIAGDTTVFGLYSQEGMKLKEDKRVIDTVKDIAEVIQLGNGTELSASRFLQHFMFTPDTQYTNVSSLSGGERRRLYLLTVLMKNPNFLILDEPTNDFDLMTLNILEEFLSSFKGCLILVSHDRYFMDKLVDHLFIFEGDGKIKDFTGNYSDYRMYKDEVLSKEREKATTKLKAEKKEKEKKILLSKEKTKLSYKEQKEFEQLETDIESLEKEKNELETSLNDGENDYEKLEKISTRLGEIIQLIDEKTLRWMELAEFIK